jgi:CDP-paratose 2-epimerase
LHSDDVVDLYFKAKDINEAYGQAFNIGGGIDNSLSLLELFALLEQTLDIKLNYKKIDWRESDQKVFVADNSKANEIIKWKPVVSVNNGIKDFQSWLR